MRAAACAAVVVLLLASCSPPSGDRDAAPRGDVLLLLTVDTLRADRLGCGGDPRARTPHLDRLARRGREYAEALSPVPLTLPAHASILTGLLPPDHGVRDNGLYRLADDVPLVSESFAAAGWRTAAFLAAYPLAARFGLARGFEVYRDAPGFRREGSGTAFTERPADAVNREVFAWLDEYDAAAPLFLWVHYFDPHAPYRPPSPHARINGGDGYRGEIHFVDIQTGRLLRRLERTFARVRVAAVADHGESLGEHGENTHGIFVYEATTRVPLVLAGPGMPAPGRPLAGPVSITALAGTLTEWAGLDAAETFEEILPTPDEVAAGRVAPEPRYVESMYPRLRHGWSSLRGLRGPRWKVIRAPEPEVYDLTADPGERTNLAPGGGLPAEVARQLESLADDRWADRLPQSERPDPEVEEALRSLGYAAVSPEARAPEDAERPDPKDRVRLESVLGDATAAIEAGNPELARGLLSRALSIEPRNKETNVLLAQVEAAVGNEAQAKALLDWCLTLPPASLDPLVHTIAGRMDLDRGRWREADDRFALAVAGDPLDVVARFYWGLAAYQDGRVETAIERWEATLRLDPDHPPTREWLARAEGTHTEETP